MKPGEFYMLLVGSLILNPILCWADTPALSDEWGGLYVGGNIGWAGSRHSAQTTTQFDPSKYYNVPSDQNDIQEVGDQDLDSNDLTGGGQIGYNWQFRWCVFGIETDFNSLSTDIFTSRSKPYTAAPTGTLTITSTAQTNWLWTVRPRLGFAIDRWLFYGSGGLTLANLEADFSVSDDYSVALGNVAEHQNISETKAGWTVGGGVEVRLDKNWSIRSEYLYADLGTLSGDTHDMYTTGGYSPNTIHHEADFTVHLVRVSLNYKF